MARRLRMELRRQGISYGGLGNRPLSSMGDSSKYGVLSHSGRQLAETSIPVAAQQKCFGCGISVEVPCIRKNRSTFLDCASPRCRYNATTWHKRTMPHEWWVSVLSHRMDCAVNRIRDEEVYGRERLAMVPSSMDAVGIAVCAFDRCAWAFRWQRPARAQPVCSWPDCLFVFLRALGSAQGLHRWDVPVGCGLAQAPSSPATGRREVSARTQWTTGSQCPITWRLGDDFYDLIRPRLTYLLDWRRRGRFRVDPRGRFFRGLRLLDRTASGSFHPRCPRRSAV